jgi:hypothetical protein
VRRYSICIFLDVGKSYSKLATLRTMGLKIVSILLITGVQTSIGFLLNRPNKTDFQNVSKKNFAPQ